MIMIIIIIITDPIDVVVFKFLEIWPTARFSGLHAFGYN